MRPKDELHRNTPKETDCEAREPREWRLAKPLHFQPWDKSQWEVREAPMPVTKWGESEEIELVEKSAFEKLREENEAAKDLLGECRDAIKKLAEIEITDGCEECSTIWTRMYRVKPAQELLKKLKEALNGKWGESK